MMRDLDTLAEILDKWAALSTVSLTETDAQLTVNQLNGIQAAEFLKLINIVEWTVLDLSDQGGEIPPDMLTPQLTGVRVSVAKPSAPQGVELILTNTAFTAALAREAIPPRFWIKRLTVPISTIGVRFAPWNDDTQDSESERPPEPGKVVRFLQPPPTADRDLCRWLLRDPDRSLPNQDSAFEVWKGAAARALAISIANEVDVDGTLLFRGPPVSRFKLDDVAGLKNTIFADLQRAAYWAYESPRELENRQGLLASEIARGTLRDGTLPALCDSTKRALEGARIAYGFGVTQQSKDTLKALSDLRKAVMDETSKLTETMRALAGAVSSAAFGAIGLIIARLTLAPSNEWVTTAAVAIGVVLGLYVASVIISGLHFMRLQRTLRNDWRARLYSFLTEEDYEKLVETPVERAERGYKTAAWCGGIITTILIVATFVILLTPLPVIRPSVPDLAATFATDQAPTPSPPVLHSQAPNGNGRNALEAAPTDVKSAPPKDNSDPSAVQQNSIKLTRPKTHK